MIRNLSIAIPLVFYLFSSQAYSLEFELVEISYPSKQFEQLKCSGASVTFTKGILGNEKKSELIASLELTQTIAEKIKEILARVDSQELSPKKSDWMPKSDGTLDGKFWYFEIQSDDGKSFVYFNSKPLDGFEKLKSYVQGKLIISSGGNK